MTRSESRPRSSRRRPARGAVAGLLGVAVMTAAEKVEQSVTHRPNPYVPGRTLLTLLRQQPGGNERRACVSRSTALFALDRGVSLFA